MNDLLHHLTYIEWRIGPAIIGIDPLEFGGENGLIDAQNAPNVCISLIGVCICGNHVEWKKSIVNGQVYRKECKKSTCRRAVCVDCYEEAEWWTVYHRDCL